MPRASAPDPSTPPPLGWPRWALLVVAALAVTLPTLRYEFLVFDDDYVVVGNQWIKSLSHLPAYFDPWGPVTHSAQEFLPLLQTSLALDHALYGLEPWGFHLTNALAYLAGVLALADLLRRIGAGPQAALAGALAFALHPLHTESTAWVADRKALLNGLLVVLALTAWVRFRRSGRPGWCALSSLSFLAAFGAKYTAASFPLALLALDLTVLRDPRRTWAQRTVPLLPACAIAGGMTLLAVTLGAEHATIKPAPGHGLRFVSNDPILLLHALRLLALPTDSCAYALWPLREGPTALTALGILVFLALAGGSWAARRRAPLLALGGALWLVFLLPVSNLVPKGLWFAERYLFLPSLGLACAVAWLWSACRGPDPRRRAARLLLALWLFGLGALTALRLPVWRDSVTLWTTTLAHPWGNPAGYDQLGLYYLTVAHEPATAQRVFEDGLRELTARGTLRTQLGIELRYHRLLCVILQGDLTSARIEWQQLQAACLASADPRSRPALAAFTAHLRANAPHVLVPLEPPR